MESWDDLRFFLALARAGTLTAAARTLGCSQPTVGRRVAALSRKRKAGLVALESGRYVVTEAGRSVLSRAQRMEEEFFGIGREIDRLDESPTGPVRASVPDGLGAVTIAARLPDFLRRHPGIQLSLVAESPVADLGRREADIALRVVRPRQRELVVRKLATIPFQPYADSSYLRRRPRAGDRLLPDDDLIDYHPSLSMPDAVWLREHIPLGVARVIVRTPLTAQAAARSGAGVALLAPYLGVGLRLLHGAPALRRDLFLVFHRSLRKTMRIRLVSDFLEECISGALT
ncbi:MAG TPA: LysR family transcriptional regulator [Myxococcales bacterium]|nr:LysR family transcriptional regulator [Myxococcales bacterium]